MLPILEKLLTRKRVCPWWLCYTFDNPLRRLFHNPMEILRPYVREGIRAVDIGAGMGYFSIPLATLVGPVGRVTAIDIQPKMLSVLASRARRKGVSDRIRTHLARPETLGFREKTDFALAFWMVHETPQEETLLSEIHSLMSSEGQFLLVEPKIHVTPQAFDRTVQAAVELGFRIKAYPRIRLSQSVLLTTDSDNK